MRAERGAPADATSDTGATASPPTLITPEPLSAERRALSLLQLSDQPGSPKAFKPSYSSPSLVDMASAAETETPNTASKIAPKWESRSWWGGGYSRHGNLGVSRPELIDFIDDCDSWSQVSVESTATDYSQTSGQANNTVAAAPSQQPAGAQGGTEPNTPTLAHRRRPDILRPAESFKRPMILQWLTKNQFSASADPALQNKPPAAGEGPARPSASAQEAFKRADIARRMRELNAVAPNNW